MKPEYQIRRRELLLGAGGLATAGLTARLGNRWDEYRQRAEVFIGKVACYDEEVERVIREGLRQLGVGADTVRGKSVLLKPNLVEPSRDSPHINTHPEVIRAAASVFRCMGARSVTVGEGQGHCTDSDLVLDDSGLGAVLDANRIPFVDLNHDDVLGVRNHLGFSRLETLFLPVAITQADFIVSMPKMKTHHWTGLTASMKNLFGVMPGVVYGWPKNVLHHAGIHESIVDINRVVKTNLAIVDGIVAMEGDGPIMGTPRRAGVIVLGRNLPAVDATCARLMGMDPTSIAYLGWSSGRLGPIKERHIVQRGWPLTEVVQEFAGVPNQS